MTQKWFSAEQTPKLKPIDNFFRQSDILLVKDIHNKVTQATFYTDTVNRSKIWKNKNGETIQIKSWKYICD